ncbi:hypothetical protein CANARDRAFT_176119 [[Candida] arabinofermentans NRRL YB-2248]|uniref:Uncharacterized protein n=1 Tax=[Candida] arabinofermentans NRRL YB-2248 TaxID=983967 RepID=A0A1E4T084_9ASCO|nr:hypothetical protein CANARDRAFT_176119 [[Candida] arabinofermentans NRRL YB-2248]
MSDLGRKSFTDKASETLKPDSQKSTFESVKEGVTDSADKFASAVTPESEKSATQTLGDKAQSGSDKASSELKSDQATLGETASEYLEAGKKAVGDAVEYVSGAITGAKEGGEATKK